MRPNEQAERWATAKEFLKRHGGRVDLRAQEARGGHTLEKPVGETARLKAMPNKRQMSTFVSGKEAKRAIQKAIRDNAVKIAEWEANSPTQTLELSTDFKGGRVLRRGEEFSRRGSSAKIVLLGDGAGSRNVLAAYLQVTVQRVGGDRPSCAQHERSELDDQHSTTRDGVRIVAAIGISRVRTQCPRFHERLSRLESL
ncbi:MAG: RNase A-like domain-containing protein [Myxococcota bacterium]